MSSNDQEFTRPAKSPARQQGGNGSLQQQIGQAASDAYDRAPDLGIGSTVSNAYNRAPDLGIQSTYDRYVRNGGQQENQSGASQGYSGQQRSSAGQQRDNGNGDDGEEEFYGQRLHNISKEHGPSSKDRLDKSQQEIGTEYGIPTNAGAGTTVSPDQTNQNALKNAKSNKAHVPEDYAPVPCPDKNAGTGKTDEVQSKYAEYANGGRKSNHGRQTSAASSSGGNATGSHTPKSTNSSEHKRRSFGEKLRDQVKGEMKILKGSLTNNNDTITQGLNIKHGEA